MSNTRMEEGLLRTDACFERHSLPRKFEYDERETEIFSGNENALRREEDHLAMLQSLKSRGEYIPRYNNRFTRYQADVARARQSEIEADFNSLCEKGSAL